MSNPFIQTVPTDNSKRRTPIMTTIIPSNPSIENYPLAATGFNSGSTYLQAGGNPTNWSEFPAVSIVNINDNILENVGGTITIKNTDNVSTNSIQTTSGQLLFNGNVVQTGPNVTSLRGLQGVVNLTSANGNLTINDVGNDIQLTVLAGGIGVESLETLAGNIGLTSTGSTVTITTVGQNINLEAVPPPAGGVTSLDTLTGAIGLTSTGSTVTITSVGQNINLETAGNAGVTSLDSLTGAIGLTSTGGSIAFSTVGQNINIEATSGSPSTWSTFSATQDVNMVNHSLTSASTSGVSVDSGVNPITPTLNLTASNGIGGKVNIIANNGIGGTSYGAIDITANGGTTAGVTSGGSINITATTPVGTVGLSGKVTINGAGINSYAGALPVLGSLTGYNYIHGDSAVNITAGAPPIVPSDPLCVYLYGTNGTLMYGTQYMGKIRPYSDLTTNPSNLVIEAYSNLITTGYVDISGCSSLVMTPTGQLSLAGNTGTDGQVLGKVAGNLSWIPNGSGGGVSSLNTLTGDLSLTSTNGSISITPSGTNIDLSVPLTATGYASPILTDVGNATWTYAITGLLSTSVVLATITDVDNIVSPENCWLINAVPSTDLLTFNMSSVITTGTTLKIAYHVTQF